MKKRKQKQYISRKRISILICIIILVIFEVVAFKESRANKIIEITASIIDNEQKLDDVEIKLEAANSGASGYYLMLPEYIENKKVGEYFIEEKSIHETKSDSATDTKTAVENTVEKTTNTENNITNMEKEANDENTINAVNNSTNISKNEVNNVTNEVVQNAEDEQTEDTAIEYAESQETTKVSKQPGEVIYLTDKEVEEKSIILTVKYNAYEKNGQALYEQKIQKQVENSEEQNQDKIVIQIEGYMPLNSEISVTNVEIETIEDTIRDQLTDKVSFKKAYDIKILYNDIEYEPTDFDTNVKVSFCGVDQINEENQKYKVVHIEDETSTVEEINGVKTKNDTVSFPAEKFSTYALLLEDGLMTTSLYSADMSTASVWDGTSATGFRFGDGTSASPYLITNAKQLSYLAEQVNNGESYDGKYFELISDIDLNNLEWTPIGDYQNPFAGVFNGAGHTIANAKISLPTSLPTSVTSYGIFGSIGNGTNKTTIKNLQLDNTNIEINASGTTSTNNTAKGYNIGTVTGTIFKNAEIKNVIVNNSSITDNYTITIGSNATQFFVRRNCRFSCKLYNLDF